MSSEMVRGVGRWFVLVAVVTIYEPMPCSIKVGYLVIVVTNFQVIVTEVVQKVCAVV